LLGIRLRHRDDDHTGAQVFNLGVNLFGVVPARQQARTRVARQGMTNLLEGIKAGAQDDECEWLGHSQFFGFRF
jgi:hypothetical protein